MYPHRIRLRGPWEMLALDMVAGGQVVSVKLPARWRDLGLAGFRGRVRFMRRFGYPGNADRDLEHFWLTCDGCTVGREVHLNGALLSTEPWERFAFDVTRLLSPRNRLEITVEAATDDAGLWGEVALEIRKDAYLEGTCVQSEGGALAVRGHVVGTAPQPLELYTTLDRRHIDYRTIEPLPEGTPFVIPLPATAPPAVSIRVELVHVSTIWYAVDLPIPHWKAD